MSPDELWLADFGDPFPGEPAHHRPALVVGPSRLFPETVPFVFVVPVTTTRRGLSLHVELEPTEASGLTHISYAQCEWVRSVNRRRLLTRLGIVDPITSREVGRILRTLFGW
ncbi:MAG: type II toxin-antitoxin system PemK/MazF family toxin [Pseudomonas sp.]|uniref:type II toxin-antitoxin system PemK/MazF family toxin n=1 Tax=Pseudomonas sp. TaxID=306 RepID=UPI00272179CC|nr:type II toxin-antitoxin system PemK/MazF family toxin [Pseudomonas sp.]MDO8403136.1 type II toxin-antitoxin system PemK/MazF family toxin [Pseudomonas sp.]